VVRSVLAESVLNFLAELKSFRFGFEEFILADRVVTEVNVLCFKRTDFVLSVLRKEEGVFVRLRP